ncbi:substrate-binding domain-containing protein [Domibacillus sp. DTU_2020_1001157_1_SI_ALB_TIR_016]|uniref:sugar ABC transporter substrate-binding protein n=1 Tax=Domibacillus sp. DTU_2020_1001157_1_SI_ALB_TIR_016 TaxID=3077789 RepID=UPI0028EB34A5|nr:substrate-binding domain-containing protein [Domibacillus sp. DTU_2020_1001157_1_SI_ALB_TIR_016]WNS79408.1 substrate-binding domain-containing protein [Domibacillus sp. DTU_2020_1001157_1_SI_ALB_TIR_016]
MKNTSKKYATAFAACLMSFSLVGCSAQSTGQGGSTSSKEEDGFNPDSADGKTIEEVRNDLGPVPKLDEEVKLGAVSKAFENEYWRTLKEGMELGAKKFTENGYDVSIDVKAAQGEGDEQGQLAIVQDMVNKKYTGLLLSPISDSNLVPGVEDALNEDIPVINVNDGIIKEAPNFVGPRAVENGELLAEWVSGKLNGEGKVAIVVGMPKAFAAKQRTLGFENWMKENAPGVEVVEKQNADWDRLKAKDLTETWIKKHPDLKAIFANNDTMALGVQEAVNASGKDILVVGVDGIQEAYDSIRKGELDATVDSFPLYKGQIAVEATLRKLAGQEVPRVIWTPQALIDSTNVDTPAEEIIKWSEPEIK